MRGRRLATVLLLPVVLSGGVVFPQDDEDVPGRYRRAWADEIERWAHQKYPEGHFCIGILEHVAENGIRSHDNWVFGYSGGTGGGHYDFTTGTAVLDMHSYYSVADEKPIVGARERSHGLWRALFQRWVHEGWHAAEDDHVEGTGAADATECAPHSSNS